jgi:hypothetical protein
MAEAFDALDAYFWEVHEDESAHAPDSAFDWIFMMEGDDWLQLSQAFPMRPVGWRAECAYVLGHGPRAECLAMLEKVIFDDEFPVASEAAVAYAAQVLEGEAPPAVPHHVRVHLAQLLEHAEARYMENVLELLQALDKRG